jgi:hypothetical protein
VHAGLCRKVESRTPSSSGDRPPVFGDGFGIAAIVEFRDIFGAALCNMLGAGDPATELRAATERFKPVLAQAR